MLPARSNELLDLIVKRYKLAITHAAQLKTAAQTRKSLYEEAEIPGFEDKPLKFGQFVNKEYVVMMTDIRDSTGIINQTEGLTNMFTIFYIYAAMVANIVDKWKGTSTEFLGDGVLSLFDVDGGRKNALANAMISSQEIFEARESLLNPFLDGVSLPTINLGIGIDFGLTIVTRFGFGEDNDLKAFGTCVYNVSKLCKGYNEIFVSDSANADWPQGEGGRLVFSPILLKDQKLAFKASLQ